MADSLSKVTDIEFGVGVGLTNIETAEALGISERTVKNYWSQARAWLFREIKA